MEGVNHISSAVFKAVEGVDVGGLFIKAGLLVILYYCLLVPVYYLWFHPLAKYPGPPTWAFSQLPWIIMYCSGKSHERMLELHDRYGSVVRTGPNELSFIAPEAWGDIMGRQKGAKENPKAPFYCPPNRKHIAAAPEEDHARMRRILHPAFSTSAVARQEPLVMGYIDKLMDRLHEQARTKPADNLQGNVELDLWVQYCTFDIIGDLFFGESFGCLNESTIHPWIDMLFAYIEAGSYTVALNRLPFLALVMPYLVPARLKKLAVEMAAFSKDRMLRRQESQTTKPDLFSHITSNPKGLTLTPDELEKNCFAVTIAGSETSAQALSAAAYYLANHPRVMRKLASELEGAFSREDEITFTSVKQLPYLKAVTDETLRLFPPAPNALPRITPPGGNTILGDHIPANVALGIPQRSMYLSERNFKRAKEFIPERWLGDAEFSDDRRDCFNPFSTGPRNCIGMNLAYSELYSLLARMVWNFDWTLAERSRTWMEDRHSFLHWDRTPLYVSLTARAKPTENTPH